jgi:hypothetical protein
VTEKTNEYAAIAMDSYTMSVEGDSVRLSGRDYQIDQIAMDGLTGFYAAAYREVASGRTIIAYRGTDDVSDGLVDLTMAGARLNLQQIESEMFTRSVLKHVQKRAELSGTSPDITVTGHSLGGGLAEVNAAKFGLKGETFNAYGAAGLIRGTPEGGNQVINHVRAGDPVSAANRHFGEVKIYANADDITTLKHAGYDRPHTGLGATLSAVSPSSHSMSNFIPKGDETPLLGPEGEARYRANSALVDRYRSDVLTSREIATQIATAPAVVAPALAIRAGQLYVDRLEHDWNELVERSKPVVEAAGRGAAVAGHAMEVGADHARTTAITGARTLGLVHESVASGVWGTPTHAAELERLLHPPRLDDPTHPDNALYRQALRGVHAIDADTGRKPDHMSENLAATLTVEARRQGLSRIDQVSMSDDFSRAYAVQGDMYSPFRKTAQVPTEIGIATSIERSSSAWRELEATQATSSVVASQTAQPAVNTETPSTHSGPSMSR